MRGGVRYQFYESADGHVLFMASEQAFWRNFCEGVGRADLFESHPGSKYADHARGDVELRKELRFGKRFVPELTRTLAKAVVAIALAAIGAGYWSLVAAHVVGAAAWSAALLAIVPWRPRRIFDRAEAKHLFDYGKHMVVVAVLVALSLRADQLVIGRFLGASALGVYTIALALPAFVFQASSGVSQVLFPAYAKLGRDRERLRSAALRTLRLAAAVFVPAGAGMGLVAAPLIAVGFGSQWSDATPVLQWMGAWAAITALTQHFGEVYKALGQTRIMTWMQAITTALTVPGLVWVASRGRGLIAIVAVLIAVRLVRLALDLIVMQRLVDLRPAAALRSVAPALVATAIMVVVVLGLGRVIPAWPAAALLTVLVAIGAAVYLGALSILDRGLLDEVRDLLRAGIGDRGLRGRDVETSSPLS
jgi:PST family polysaccharide transporter